MVSCLMSALFVIIIGGALVYWWVVVCYFSCVFMIK